MKTFTAPAWLETELSDGTFTYTPVPHPDHPIYTDCVCPATVEVADDTTFAAPFDPDVWQGTAEAYTLSDMDSNTVSRGVLTLTTKCPPGCSGTCTTGTCQTVTVNGLTHCVCQ